MLVPRRKRNEENADARGGGDQRRTLTLRRRADMDTDVEDDRVRH